MKFQNIFGCFFSTPVKTIRLFAIVLGVLACQHSIHAQTLKADYQFQGNLNSSVAGAPAMTNLTGSGGANSFAADTVDGYARQSLRFPFNSGVAVDTSGLIPNNAYTIVMLFRVDETSGFRRIISFDNGTTDNGGYIQDGRLEFEATTNAAFFPNTYIQVVVVREASGAVRAYRDGGFRVNIANDGGAFQITANTLRFFQDDPLPPTEATAGNLARLRLYDAAMTTTQVRLLDRLPNVGGGNQPILFTTGRDGFNEIYTMNADGGNQRRLTFNEFSDYEAKWSPDKTKIVFTRRESNAVTEQIWIMNADGSGQTLLSNSPTTNDHAADWKPDGSKILFSRCDANFVCDLWTMNPNGSGQAIIPGTINTTGDEDRSDYSPDGTKIVFFCATANLTILNICAANADGTNRQQLTNAVSPIIYDSPNYSPDGAKIAFRRASDSANSATSEVFVMDSNGANQTNLTNNTIFDGTPFWSPDGTRLVFISQRESVFVEVYTMNAANGGLVQRLTVNSVSDVPTDWYRSSRTAFDFDGDGRADVSVFRPDTGVWYIQQSTAGFTGLAFGLATDRLVPADYDGDGKADIAVYRGGTWYLQRSQLGFTGIAFGDVNDIPIPADYDGDGRADLAVFRPLNGTWYLQRSSLGFTGIAFGLNGDKPVPADYDGDGKADIAVNRNGIWYLNLSTTGFIGVQFGDLNDKLVPADYDGDGKADVAVFRPSNGVWYLLRSRDGFTGVAFGLGTDLPVAADYDGDGKADVAVFRDGIWYLNRSTAGFTGVVFGAATDRPIPNAFVR